jgi:hypothetical protein
VSHTLVHPPQLRVLLRSVSQPFAFGTVVLQSAHPVLQPVYVHVVPLHVPPSLCCVSQELPQPPQAPLIGVSQPFVSGAFVSQLANPILQLVYVHFVPSHAAPLLFVVSHALPQPPQFVIVLTGLLHPSVSGGVVSQLANPTLQLVYLQVVPSHVAPLLRVVSHTLPQPVQLNGELSDDSHPFVSGAVVSQSANPALQPEYEHVVPLHEAPSLFNESHAAQPAQFDVVLVGMLQPTRFGGVVVQSAHPPLHV